MQVYHQLFTLIYIFALCQSKPQGWSHFINTFDINYVSIIVIGALWMNNTLSFLPLLLQYVISNSNITAV